MQEEDVSDKALQFTVYDFLGYIIPGLIVTWAGQEFAFHLLDIDRGDWPLKISGDTASDVLEAAVFVVVAFVVGHFVQAIMKPAERLLLGDPQDATSALLTWIRSCRAQGVSAAMGAWVRSWGSRSSRGCGEESWRYWGNPELRALMDRDGRYALAFKDGLKGRLKNMYGFSPLECETFKLAEAYVRQTGATLSETFVAIYGLWRGLVCATLLVSILYVARSVDERWFIDAATSERTLWLLASLALVAFVLSVMRARHFYDVYFDSVYRAVVARPSGTPPPPNS
jgi:hypothetical protein